MLHLATIGRLFVFVVLRQRVMLDSNTRAREMQPFNSIVLVFDYDYDDYD